jgi:predicted component of type VI protein secretion system
MAYLILSDKIGEFERRPLDGPLTIGRSPECQVSVKDILLSRRHCRIEQVDGRWYVEDLGSKNGTVINGETVMRHALQDGQTIRIGRTKATFFAGDIAGAPAAPPKRERPADPVEALAGTVAGFEYQPPADTEEMIAAIPKVTASTRGTSPRRSGPSTVPSPRPQPRPGADKSEAALEMLTADSSTSWESIYAEARQSVALEPADVAVMEPRARPKSPVDLTLHTNLKTGGRTWRGLKATVKRAWSKITRPTTRRLSAV